MQIRKVFKQFANRIKILVVIIRFIDTGHPEFIKPLIIRNTYFFGKVIFIPICIIINN